MLNRKGQAMTELAIFGSLLLVCFAMLLSYIQNLSEQQALKMQAFRMALQKAYDDNGFATYNILKNPRQVNLFGGLAETGRGSNSAGASVLWCKGEVENFGYFQVNEDVIELPDDVSVSEIELDADTNYTANEQKDETLADITTSRQGGLQDTITTTLKTDGGDIVITQGLDQDGRYRQSAVGKTLSRSRIWTTPF